MTKRRMHKKMGLNSFEYNQVIILNYIIFIQIPTLASVVNCYLAKTDKSFAFQSFVENNFT
jgi:hypothetical protein